jgi:hypothetical protein
VLGDILDARQVIDTRAADDAEECASHFPA